MSELLNGNGAIWYKLLNWSAILLIVIFIRYLIFSQLFEYLVQYLQQSIQWSKRVLTQNKRVDHQKKREIILSFWTSIIFSLMGAGLIFLWYKGYTRLYHSWDTYPVYWLVLGPIFFLLLQETYYYWLHRWMHLPKVYRLVHQKHHDSIETSAWTAFSFHPIESVLQAIFIPATVIILPIQEYVFLGLLMFMTLSATINHAGLEVYPKWFLTKRPFRWFIGATHHDLHHRQFLCNYGLYFTFWDQWMGTESKEYSERVEQIGK